MSKVSTEAFIAHLRAVAAEFKLLPPWQRGTVGSCYHDHLNPGEACRTCGHAVVAYDPNAGCADY